MLDKNFFEKKRSETVNSVYNKPNRLLTVLLIIKIIINAIILKFKKIRKEDINDYPRHELLKFFKNNNRELTERFQNLSALQLREKHTKHKYP